MIRSRLFGPLVLIVALSLLFGVSRVLHQRAREGMAPPRLEKREVIRFDPTKSSDPILLGVAVSPRGAVGMLDSKSGSVRVFSATGTFLYQTPVELPGGGRLLKPMSIAFGADETLYLLDTGNQRVVRFAADGSLGILGGPGVFNGQFTLPTDIAVVDGGLYVIDAALCRVSRFAPDGTFQVKVGRRGTGPGAFGVPTTLACDGDSGLLVLDSKQRIVSRFDASLGFLNRRRISAIEADFPIDRIACAGEGLSFFLSRKRQEIAVFYQEIPVDLLTPKKLGLGDALITDMAGQGNSLYLLDGKGRSVSRFEIAN